MKPAQTACTSKAAHPLAPSAACTRQATDGKTMSDVVVATMIRSISEASTFAASSALRAAATAKDDVVSPSASSAKWRLSMPVRVRIHSSLVSMPSRASMAANSPLVTMRFGSALPVPKTREYMEAFLLYS